MRSDLLEVVDACATRLELSVLFADEAVDAHDLARLVVEALQLDLRAMGEERQHGVLLRQARRRPPRHDHEIHRRGRACAFDDRSVAGPDIGPAAVALAPDRRTEVAPLTEPALPGNRYFEERRQLTSVRFVLMKWIAVVAPRGILDRIRRRQN